MFMILILRMLSLCIVYIPGGYYLMFLGMDALYSNSYVINACEFILIGEANIIIYIIIITQTCVHGGSIVWLISFFFRKVVN